MASVFISHRGADGDLAVRLASDLEGAGHNVRLDVWEINVGDEIAEWMSDCLETASYVVVCYSSHGMAPWMAKEVWASVARQLNGLGVKVLPVRLSGGQPPALLSGVKYADFVRDWDSALDQLLRAIR